MREQRSVGLVDVRRLRCIVLVVLCFNAKALAEEAANGEISGVRRKVNIVLGVEPIKEVSLHVELNGSTPHVRIMRAVFPPIYAYLSVIILSPSGRRTTLKQSDKYHHAVLTECFIIVDSGGNDVAMLALESDSRMFPSDEQGRNALRKFTKSNGNSQPSRFESMRTVSRQVDSLYRLECVATLPTPPGTYRAVSLLTKQPEKETNDPWLYVVLFSQNPNIDRFRNAIVVFKTAKYVRQEVRVDEAPIEICYAIGNDVVVEQQQVVSGVD